jgi:hypothetical protein
VIKIETLLAFAWSSSQEAVGVSTRVIPLMPSSTFIRPADIFTCTVVVCRRFGLGHRKSIGQVGAMVGEDFLQCGGESQNRRYGQPLYMNAWWAEESSKRGNKDERLRWKVRGAGKAQCDMPLKPKLYRSAYYLGPSMGDIDGEEAR